jgi:ABC-type transport system involved in cytochrome bd biosynthesis fused ATPase/permease subunit
MEVAEIVLLALAEKGLLDYRKILVADIFFYEKVQCIVQMKHDNSENLRNDFIRDVYGAKDSKLKNILEETQERISKTLKRDLTKAQKKR